VSHKSDMHIPLEESFVGPSDVANSTLVSCVAASKDRGHSKWMPPCYMLPRLAAVGILSRISGAYDTINTDKALTVPFLRHTYFYSLKYARKAMKYRTHTVHEPSRVYLTLPCKCVEQSANTAR
jgi:hypothetical protein